MRGFIPIASRLDQIKRVISNCVALSEDDWIGNITIAGSLYQADIIYARVLFVSMCRGMGVPVKAIGKILGVNHSTVCYYGCKYRDWIEVDSRFKALEKMVEKQIEQG